MPNDATTSDALLAMDKRELIDEVIRLREVLMKVRNVIDDDPDNLNLEVIVDTVWVSPIETMVDYIDAALGVQNVAG